ncbi:MAG: phosphate signaling complex protein PhoU [Aeromonadaceae bacterium]|nr:phosphate signaling complex protein PhoU [Aeromonadaceae bacterium]
MDNMNLNKHISGQFNTELEAVRNNVLAMGGLVEQQLADALVAIHDQDLELARRIVETDLRVNDMEISIDEECTRIIAKRQPTASDLRLILMISKAVTDLERMGDVADKLARMVINNTSRSHPPLVSLESMGRQAIKMLHDALDAFARMDVEAAIQLYHDDDKIDRQYESIIRELMTYMMEDPRTIPQVLEVLWAARSLERIGDRCQHISDYIIYCVKGKDVRHTKISDLGSL